MNLIDRRTFIQIPLLSLVKVEEEIKNGDILLTRNVGGEVFNQTPGYYNHSALVGPLNWVIEAQQTPDAIIAVPIWNFFDRYPEILVLRNVDSKVADKTAQIATQYVGRPYSARMSIRPLFLWKSSDNCVSFIKRVYNQVTNQVHRWIKPDDFLQTRWLQRVLLKKDYENFIAPKNNYMGMQKTWSNEPASKYID